MSKMSQIERTIQLENDIILPVFGQFDSNIRKIEKSCGVQIVNRGDDVKVVGEERGVHKAWSVLNSMAALARRGEEITEQNLEYFISSAEEADLQELEKVYDNLICITANGRPLKPKTMGQKKYIDLMKNNTVVFGIGPAGTGKTYLAMAMAITAFKNNEVNRIILTRPAIEAGEKLGFLPGDLQQKVDPYLRPLYDALYEIMGVENFTKNMEKGLIEVAPLAYMRGRTLDNAYIVLDEAQNTTPEQMKQKYNIDCRLNAEVEFINRKDKSVTVKGREPESYDKLIIATGAYQLRPDINGILGEQIFTVNNLESIYKIKDFVKYNQPRNVVIMGGGYTGVEMAENLMRLGLKVSIVEASPHLLPGLDYDMAATLHNYLRGKGLRLYLNRRLTGFGDSKVTLDNGLTIEYDMAVVATGVRPDPKLTIMSDLEIGKSGGIKVDDHMQTSDKDIYAAGDDVEVTDFITRQPVRMAQAGLAVKEAKVIADHLGGLDSRFEHALGTSIIKVFEMTAASAGANEEKLKKAGISYKHFNLYGFDHSAYMPDNELLLLKLLFDADGKILGAQAIGRGNVSKRIDILALAMQNGMHAAGLENAEFAYAPPFSAGKDVINNLGSMADNLLSERVKTVNYKDLQELKDEIMLIDIRTPQDFDAGHIENAVNIPLTALRNNLDAIPHEKKVVLYCRYGAGSYAAARILENRGFDNIYILNGGMELYGEILRDEAETDALTN